jgi:hypothetical protein
LLATQNKSVLLIIRIIPIKYLFFQAPFRNWQIQRRAKRHVYLCHTPPEVNMKFLSGVNRKVSESKKTQNKSCNNPTDAELPNKQLLEAILSCIVEIEDKIFTQEIQKCHHYEKYSASLKTILKTNQ